IQAITLMFFAYLTTPLAVYFSDFRVAVTPLLLVSFFLTPIFYSVDQLPPIAREIVSANPVTVLVNAYRNILLYGSAPDLIPLTLLGVLAWLGASLALRVFRQLEPGLAEQL